MYAAQKTKQKGLFFLKTLKKTPLRRTVKVTSAFKIKSLQAVKIIFHCIFHRRLNRVKPSK